MPPGPGFAQSAPHGGQESLGRPGVFLGDDLKAVAGALRPGVAGPQPHNGSMRLLHTMLRVGDLDRSIAFYTQVLGMSLLRRSENPEYRYSLAFLGFDGGNPGQAEIELTYNWGTTQYELGTAFGHIALGVPDAYAACERIKAAGGQVTREAGPVKGGSTVIAFVTDPDGYKIELIQTRSTPDGDGRHSDAKPIDPLRSA